MPFEYQQLNVKPMSVNEAWQGKRFKTVEYKAYEFAIWSRLPKAIEIPETGDLQLHLVWGFSSASSDFDNPVKPFVDILQKRYKFNDKRIKRAFIDVENVPKGAEFIKFAIFPKNPSIS
jgi:hypothetical protein